jgi:hypothetical protein
MGDRTALILLINIYICGIQADRERFAYYVPLRGPNIHPSRLIPAQPKDTIPLRFNFASPVDRLSEHRIEHEGDCVDHHPMIVQINPFLSVL